jgi:ABC-type multidrug transport system fused ATPase/permease subunit
MKNPEKKNRIKLFFELFRTAFWDYRWKIVFLTILAFFGGLLEGVGINTLIPLFSFIAGDGQGGTDIISKTIKKIFLFLHIPFTLKYLLLLIISLFFLRSVFTIVFQYFHIKIITDYEEKTRAKLFAKTLNASWPYLLKQKLGHLESILMTDIQIGKSILSAIVSITMILLNLVVYIFIALNISVPITAFTLVVGGMLFFIIKPLMRRSRIVGRETSKAIKLVSHFINQNVLGLKTIKSMMVSDQIVQAGRKHFVKLKELSVRSFLLGNISGSSMQFISIIFVCAVFTFSYKRPGFNFAALVAIIYLVQRLFDYIKSLQLSFQKTGESAPYLLNVLAYEKKVVNFEEEDFGRLPFKFNNKFDFEKVSFSYDSSKEVLSEISFSIKKGEMVGLVGPSGMGKTTIVDLILRLFNPTSGRITLDNNDISQINMKEWRKNIGYVSQDMFLFNGTIAENIKFYDELITEQDIEEAAKMANIYDFIENCPDKFKTVLGERGVLLSMGQRQRVIIARILARKPQMLILDEATSALDNESEMRIQKVIERLKGKVTVLVVAHRLSTLLSANRVLGINQGRIIEEGNPQELLKNKDSYFYKTYNIRG